MPENFLGNEGITEPSPMLNTRCTCEAAMVDSAGKLKTTWPARGCGGGCDRTWMGCGGRKEIKSQPPGFQFTFLEGSETRLEHPPLLVPGSP